MGASSTQEPATSWRPVATGRPALGLALGAGAVRGLAHIGVLQALLDAGLRPQVVAGTSAGSLVGALFAAGVEPPAMTEAAPDLLAQVRREMRLSPWGMLVLGSRLTLQALRRAAAPAPQGMAAGNRLESWLRRHLPVQEFGQMRLPFAAVACDLHSGEAVLLTRRAWLPGPLPPRTVVVEEVTPASAVRASCSIPWLYTPKRLAGRALIDGGTVEPVPARVCRLLGAEVVVAVDLGTGHRQDGDVHALPRVVDRAAAILLQRLTDLQLERHADVVVRPTLAPPADGALPLEGWIRAGYEAAWACRDAIRRSLARAAAMASRTESGAVPPTTRRARSAASTSRHWAASAAKSGL